MLKITFKHFRCWDNLTIQAPIGSITLIKGASGVGKTTIFQGITWCLYGNIRLVTPINMEKAKTSVVLEIPYNSSSLVINRHKNPNRLVVHHENKVYEDKVAQEFIDDIFGNYDIWLASCYIGQGCRNNFLTSPNTGKMELLNSIAFHEEDPSFFIEKIDENISNIDSLYKLRLSNFNTNLANFQSLVTTVDTSKFLTPDQVNTTKENILTLQSQIQTLRNVKSQREVNLTMLTSLEKKLDHANIQVVTIPDVDPALASQNEKYNGNSLDIPEEIQNTINDINVIIPSLQRRDDLYSEMMSYDNRLLPFTNFNDDTIYTQEDYQAAIGIETKLKEHITRARNFNISYTEAGIQTAIQRCNNLLADQDRLILEHEAKVLLARKTKLEADYNVPVNSIVLPEITSKEIPVPDYTQYNTEHLATLINTLSQEQGTIRAHIDHLRKGCGVLQCPHCNGSVRYQNGALNVSDVAPSNNKEIEEANQAIQNIVSRINAANSEIQALTRNEQAARSNYERAVAAEHQRINNLHARVRQLELEKQRADLAREALGRQIVEVGIAHDEVVTKIASFPELNSGSVLLTKEAIGQVHSTISELRNIMILEEPRVKSEHIHTAINYQNIKKSYLTAKDNYNAHLETIPIGSRQESIRILRTFVEKLRQRANAIRDAAKEKERLDNLKCSLAEQINALKEKIVDDPSEEINKLLNNIKEYEELLVLSEKAKHILDIHASVTKEREEVLTINEELSSLNSLRQYAVETECHILQQMVDSVNTSIDSVCTTLFDRDITITLNLFKRLKTTKNVKPVVNFEIAYQGGVFDNINQMSGGEGDRASLALTLALSRLSSCPILMLDESLASLDISMKEAAIRAIRENTNNTVLIIMHDGVEGIFDEVINIDEIRDTHN